MEERSWRRGRGGEVVEEDMEEYVKENAKDVENCQA